MEHLLTGEALVSLFTLTAMETVLGIDNVVFISILAGKLPKAQQDLARRLGLSLALIVRLGLLFALSWIMRLTAPLFSLVGHEFSGRDLILLIGGGFLIAKATYEIYDKVELSPEEADLKAAPRGTFALTIFQILLLDIVFSLDSVITAVGMARHIAIMVVAMIVSVIIMLIFAKRIGDFVNRHPSMKILALSFLILIGVMLVADGMGEHVAKGYIYSAMTFSLAVELLNMRFRKQRTKLAPGS